MVDFRNRFAAVKRHRRELPVLVEAGVWLAAARLILILLEFRRVARLLTATRRLMDSTSESIETATRIGWAVRTVARHVPWRAMCFEQSIATQQMLMRRGFAAHLVFGVAKREDGKMEAHVWTNLGERTIVGGSGSGRFTPIMVFRPGCGPVAVNTQGDIKSQSSR